MTNANKCYSPHPRGRTSASQFRNRTLYCFASIRSNFDTTDSWEEAQIRSCSIRAEQLMVQPRCLRRAWTQSSPLSPSTLSRYIPKPPAQSDCLLQILLAGALAALSLGVWLTFTAARIKVRGAAPHELDYCSKWIIKIRENKVRDYTKELATEPQPQSSAVCEIPNSQATDAIAPLSFPSCGDSGPHRVRSADEDENVSDDLRYMSGGGPSRWFQPCDHTSPRTKNFDLS